MNSINMRSSKMKFFIYGCVICGMVLTVYLLSTTHSKLKNVKGAYDICLQQKDSLLAQLQVVYEQKSRVEKSLQKEKLDHKKTNDEFQDSIRAKSDLDKEKKDGDERYSLLQQEHQSLQDKYTSLKEKEDGLENNLHKYQAEADNVAQNKDNEIKELNGKISSFILSNEQLKQSYDNQIKDIQQLTEKLQSLQALNDRLQEQAQIIANLPDKKISGKQSVESNQINSKREFVKNDAPTQINKQANQGNLELNGLGGGENNVANGDQSNAIAAPANLTNNHNGEGANTGGGNDGIGNLANANDKTEFNDVKKPEESKMQLQQPEEKKISAQTLSKPRINDMPDKNEFKNVLPKPKTEISVKEEESQVLQQPSNVIQENPTINEHKENEGLEGDPVPPQKQENGETNRIGRWEGNLKRGPQLNIPAGSQGNHPNEEDDYRGEEGGDDDAAEEDGGDEGFPPNDKNVHEKRFQDHDFEDNEDQNHAKEIEGHEGVVVQPK